jgi:hypothetical protein
MTAVVLLLAAAVWAQQPSIVQNTRAKLQTAQKTWNAQQSAADAALAQTASPTGSGNEAGTVPDANQLLPQNAVGTESGERKMTESAKRNAYRRDPFISPVVTRMSGSGSGCSSGKRCLSSDSISLRGIVKSQDGMIAVVVNAANKAYFLRENDPIFNGYVAKITADSMVLRESVQDVLGRKSTRDVVKKLFVPVV